MKRRCVAQNIETGLYLKVTWEPRTGTKIEWVPLTCASFKGTLAGICELCQRHCGDILHKLDCKQVRP